MNKRTLTLSFPWKRESRLLSFSFVLANPFKRMKQSIRTSFLSSVIASVAKQSLFLSFPWKRESRLYMSLRNSVILVAISIMAFLILPSFAFAEEKIPVFPTTPVEVYTVYATLALLWLGIIGLIVIIKMKLIEIERIQKLGIDKDDLSVPMLD